MIEHPSKNTEAPRNIQEMMEVDEARGGDNIDGYIQRLATTSKSRYAMFSGAFGGRPAHFSIPKGSSEEWIRSIYEQYKKAPMEGYTS